MRGLSESFGLTGCHRGATGGVFSTNHYLRRETDLGNTGSMLNDGADMVWRLVDKTAWNTEVFGKELRRLISHIGRLQMLLPHGDFTGFIFGVTRVKCFDLFRAAILV